MSSPPGRSPQHRSSLTQLDPSTKDYAYYVLSYERVTLAEIIVTATTGAGFEARKEYWKVLQNFDTSEIRAIDLSKDAGTWRSSPFPAREASFVLPTGARWESRAAYPNLSSAGLFGLEAKVSRRGDAYVYSIAWYNQTGDSMFKDVELPFEATMSSDGMQTFEWYQAVNANQG